MFYRRGSCLGGCFSLPFLLLAAPFIWLFRPRRFWRRGWYGGYRRWRF